MDRTQNAPHYYQMVFSPRSLVTNTTSILKEDIGDGKVVVDEDGYYHALGFGSTPEIAKANAYAAALEHGIVKVRNPRRLRRFWISLLGMYQVQTPTWFMEWGAPYFPKTNDEFLSLQPVMQIA